MDLLWIYQGTIRDLLGNYQGTRHLVGYHKRVSSVFQGRERRLARQWLYGPQAVGVWDGTSHNGRMRDVWGREAGELTVPGQFLCPYSLCSEGPGHPARTEAVAPLYRTSGAEVANATESNRAAAVQPGPHHQELRGEVCRARTPVHIPVRTFAANQAPPRIMQNRVRPSLRWLSVHCHTLPHIS